MDRVIACLLLAGATAAVTAQQVEKQEYPGIRNFSRVDATIACGGATSPEAMASLKKDGFVSVVNLRMAGEPGANIDASKSAAAAAGLQYFHVPFNMADPATDLVDRFIATVAEPKNQPVLIHCGSANRVAALWLIKRVKVDGWPVQKALDEATAIGLTSEKLKTFALEYLKTQGSRAPEAPTSQTTPHP